MKKLLLVFVFITGAFLSHAQKNYAVKIAESKTGDPLDSAHVIIKSTGKNAITGVTGLLVMQAAPGDTLTVSRNGYTSQEAILSASSMVHVLLEKKPEEEKKQ